MKEDLPHRVVYLSFALEDLALAEELKACFASLDYPDPKFCFPKSVFAHFCGMNRTLNHLRIEDAACVVLIYTEHTNGTGMIVRDLEDARKLGKPIFPLWLSDAPVSPELEALVDTENHQLKATCLTKKELIVHLGAYELMKCIFHI